MPELPEVETVRRGLDAAWTGRRFTRVETRRADLRFPLPEQMAARLTERTIIALRRRAKYLLADLDDDNSLIVHLGMSGSFRLAAGDAQAGTTEVRPAATYYAQPRLEQHDHVVFHTSDGGVATFNDPRRFGFMRLVPTAQAESGGHLGVLGLEPLEGLLDATTLASATVGKRVSLKAALLDQSVIAGLGNIYVCEALHRAGLSPRRSAATLSRKDGSPTARAVALAPAIVDVLLEAVEAGGSTLRDFSSTDGVMGYFQHRFRVYDREGQACRKPGCPGAVTRIVQSGRSTYFCPRCQR